MNSTHRGIILLMKSAATGQRGILPDDFSLQEAMPVITAHQIAPLAYTGAVNCGENPQNPAMVALLQTYCSHMLQSELQMRQISRIFRCFRDNGVDFLPLKGCVMKTRYPRPDLRSMGDADIVWYSRDQILKEDHVGGETYDYHFEGDTLFVDMDGEWVQFEREDEDD